MVTETKAEGLTDAEFERIVGHEANRLIEASGGFYIQDVRQKVVAALPPEAVMMIYAHPFFSQMLLEGIHKRIYNWLQQFERTGRFRGDHTVTRHPAYGCLPDGKGNYVWFRVADVGPDIIDKWIASRQRKIARLQFNLQPLMDIRQRLQRDQRVKDIIDYD